MNILALMTSFLKKKNSFHSCLKANLSYSETTIMLTAKPAELTAWTSNFGKTTLITDVCPADPNLANNSLLRRAESQMKIDIPIKVIYLLKKPARCLLATKKRVY